MLKRLAEFNKRRSLLQTYTWWGLPLVVIGGWFYPELGYLLLGCMVGAIAIAVYKGRAWCDWMCPRGSFYDLFIQKISRNRKIPEFLRKKVTRIPNPDLDLPHHSRTGVSPVLKGERR